MAKELYIYSPLWDFTAETVVKQLNDVPENEDLTIRMHTPGGNVMAGWAIISKMSERTGKLNAVIDGDAASMGAMMLVFFDNVVANDTSSIMFHKAAYPSWYKPNDQEMQKLKTINAQFKEKLKAKLNDSDQAKTFLSKVFEADVRNDVEITPAEAKKIGIVNEVRKLEPKAFQGMQIVALQETPNETEVVEIPIPKAETNTPESGAINNKSKIVSMTKAELQAQHPTVYAEIVNEGILQERDRVEAWAVFNEIDPVKVKAGIESGKQLSSKAMAEFNLQAMSGKKLEAMETENAEETNTEAEAKTAEQIEAEKDQALLDKVLGPVKTYE